MSGSDTPWASGDLAWPTSVLEAVETHCRIGYPDEACGFVLGPVGEPRRLTRYLKALNAQDKYHRRFPEEFPRTARTAYFIEPKVILDVFDDAQKRGDAVKVIYHSHIDHESYFSEEDRKAATFGDTVAYPVAFLVISVCEGEVRGRKLFAWEPEGRRFIEVPVTVDETREATS